MVQRIVMFLGAAALLLIAGDLWLVHAVIARDHPTPESVAMLGSLTTLTGTTIGALGALLVSTRSGPAEPAPVTVENEPTDAVPVEEAPKKGR